MTISTFLYLLLSQPIPLSNAVKQWGRRGLARLVATSCVLCVGPFVMSFLSGNFWLSMALLALGYLLGEVR